MAHPFTIHHFTWYRLCLSCLAGIRTGDCRDFASPCLPRTESQSRPSVVEWLISHACQEAAVVLSSFLPASLMSDHRLLSYGTMSNQHNSTYLLSRPL